MTTLTPNRILQKGDEYKNRRFKRDRWIAYIKGDCGKNGGHQKND